MELYKLKTLSINEKIVLLSQRDQIADENIKVKWQQKRQTQNILTTINGSVVDDQLLDTTTYDTSTKIKSDTNYPTDETPTIFFKSASAELLPTATTSLLTSKINNNKDYCPAEVVVSSSTTTIVIEPSYRRHRFCKFTDYHAPRFSASLSKYYQGNNSSSDDDDEDASGDDNTEDGDEIYNPHYPYITKAMMREYIDIFTFEELFRNDLLHRLNESLNPKIV
jgi:hypothetical protein